MLDSGIVTLIVVAGVLAGIVAIGVVVDRRRKRDGATGYGGAGAFGVLDEIYHPSVKYTVEAAEVERVLPAPAPLAGDKGLDEGSIVITLPASDA
jgi:hypothetical protein